MALSYVKTYAYDLCITNSCSEDPKRYHLGWRVEQQLGLQGLGRESWGLVGHKIQHRRQTKYQGEGIALVLINNSVMSISGCDAVIPIFNCN